MDGIYQDRVILYLDILGFRELIAKGKEGDVLEALKITKELRSSYPFNGETPFQMDVFSDSVVVSTLVNDGEGVVKLVFYASVLIWRFLELGILTRGGITIGSLHHRESILFGPGMNRAHELESMYALYPRVILDEVVYEVFESHELRNFSKMLPLNIQIFRRDFDGLLHINFMNEAAMGPRRYIKNIKPNPGGGVSYTSVDSESGKVECLKDLFKVNIPQTESAKIKHNWLRQYINSFPFANNSFN